VRDEQLGKVTIVKTLSKLTLRLAIKLAIIIIQLVVKIIIWLIYKLKVGPTNLLIHSILSAPYQDHSRSAKRDQGVVIQGWDDKPDPHHHVRKICGPEIVD
jgi:hypothetical protein